MPRELIDTGTQKRYVRRDKKHVVKQPKDAGRSLARDQKRESNTSTKRGEGDQKVRRVGLY